MSPAELESKKHMKEESQAIVSTTLPPITRDSIRAGIAKSATAIGCDKKRAVSGTELLIIFIRELEAQGVLPSTFDRVRAVQIASNFDANSSAMTKRLYESGDGAPIDKAAALAAMLSAPMA